MEISCSKTAAELRKLLDNEKNGSDARAVIASLFDEGTFVEIGTYVKRRATEFDILSASEFEGVITGYGAVDGRLTFAFVQDFSRMKGALGEAHAKKICTLYDMAIKNSAPVIGVFSSAGASVIEGIDALSGYGKIMKKASAASGMIPQIALISGVCSGSAAVIASIFDFIVAADKAQLYVAPPFILKEQIKHSYPQTTAKTDKADKIIGSADAAAALGVCAIRASDIADAGAKVRSLLYYLPANCDEGTVYAPSGDEINRLNTDISALISEDGYDMKSAVAAISDNAAFFELYKDYAPEMLTGFVTINNSVVAVVANQPAVNGGELSAAAADKASDFVSFAGNFGIPVLTLVDTKGFEVSAENENAPYAPALARLAFAYSTVDVPLVSVVLGKAYGSAFTLMGSKAVGADIAFAVDNAKISIMPPEAAVEFINDKEIKESKVPSKTREYYLNEWNNLTSSPLSAARSGDIDDIISCDELRMRVAAAFEMLNFKNGGVE